LADLDRALNMDVFNPRNLEVTLNFDRAASWVSFQPGLEIWVSGS
jgi:hypothetical protein